MELQRLQPIVLDAAYRPRQTPLLSNAAASGCVTIEGIEMLFEQVRRMCGRRGEVIRRGAVLVRCKCRDARVGLRRGRGVSCSRRCLSAQGCAQCEIWTHRPAPRREIAVGLAAFLQQKAFGELPKLLSDAMR